MLQNVEQLKPHVKLNNISHHYGDKLILDDISFSIKRGEIICLLGNSGSGKSTLLRLIAGVETLKSGTITINDKVIVDEATFVPPEMRKIGMVFQDYALFPHLTIVKNIMFGKGRDGNISRAQALKHLEYIGLTDYADSYPNTLSGGQQQRVALARTMVTEPDILLLDEPFSGLDSHLREGIRIETKKLIKNKNVSAIFVTHNAEEALYLSDRIILLNNCKIEQIGTPEELLNRPATAFAAHYLRRYNQVNVQIKAGIVHSPFGDFKIKKLNKCSRRQIKDDEMDGLLLIAENDIHLASYDDPDKFDHQINVEISHVNHYSEFSELLLNVVGCDQKLTLRTSLREKDVKIGDRFDAHFNYHNILIFADKS